MSPLVSVTIVSYNQVNFIKECLDSVINQDYDNFEICIADDCSTDGTSEVIQEYADKHPSLIKYLKGTKNLGPTKNCNLALMAISGKYCAMTAGDDIMLPGKLKAQVAFMEADPTCRISYHNSAITDVKKGTVMAYSDKRSFSGTGTFETLLAKGSFIGACTAMFRTEYMPLNGLDERLLWGADWKLHLDILESGGFVKYIDQVLAKHLRHSQNITSLKDPTIELQRFQDVMTTCGLMLCQHPHLAKIVKSRMSMVLREMRTIHDGEKFNHYLNASMAYKPNLKSLIGIILTKFNFFT